MVVVPGGPPGAFRSGGSWVSHGMSGRNIGALVGPRRAHALEREVELAESCSPASPRDTERGGPAARLRAEVGRVGVGQAALAREPDERARGLARERARRSGTGSRGRGSASRRTGAARWFWQRGERAGLREACAASACSGGRGRAPPGAAGATRPPSSRSDTSRRACLMNGIWASSVGDEERAPGSASRAKPRISGSASFSDASAGRPSRNTSRRLGIARLEVVLLARERGDRPVEVGDQLLERLLVARQRAEHPAPGRSSTRPRSWRFWPRVASFTCEVFR